MRILSSLPFSLLAFMASATLYSVQLIPKVGVVLMMLAAPYITGVLVNVGMFALLVEVPIRRFAFKHGRTSLMWLLIPIAYFGWYEFSAYSNYQALQNLRSEYDFSNGQVSIPFDPEEHSLVLANGAHGYADSLTQDYGLPVAYVENENVSGGYLSTRIVQRNLCSKVRNQPLLRVVSIHVYGFQDVNRIQDRRFESHFCSLRMPAQPQKTVITVKTIKTETKVDGLPVKLIENRVTMPDGAEYILRGGTAAPYPWFPMPIMGCALNSSNPSWDCFRGFWRNDFSSIVTSSTRYGGDARVLAKALGLKRTAPHERNAIDAKDMGEKFQQAIELQLEQDIAELQATVADPSSRLSVHSIRMLEQKTGALKALAPTIVEGIKRAAQITDNPYRYSKTGRTLAQLFGKLPYDIQNKYADDMTLLYKQADEAMDGRHWLYKAAALLRFRKPLGYEPPALLAE